MKLTIVAVASVMALLLSGCSAGDPNGGTTDDAPGLKVTETTGGIRGVVVDQAITPLVGAAVNLAGGLSTKSDAAGLFSFTGLQPGDYFIQVTKPGFRSVQASATVVAGEADPPIVRVLLDRLASADPYLEHFKLNGFYECGFGTVVITDSCDFAYRTVWDGYNESAPPPAPRPLPLPRSPTASQNTQFVDVGADTWTIIQEAFWSDSNVPAMMISLDETPIDNACDCSPSYMILEAAASPTYNRLDTVDENGKTDEPAGVRAAARGFLPFGDPSFALNFGFVILTSLFHNYPAPEGWTFETKDQFPIG